MVSQKENDPKYQQSLNIFGEEINRLMVQHGGPYKWIRRKQQTLLMNMLDGLGSESAIYRTSFRAINSPLLRTWEGSRRQSLQLTVYHCPVCLCGFTFTKVLPSTEWNEAVENRLWKNKLSFLLAITQSLYVLVVMSVWRVTCVWNLPVSDWKWTWALSLPVGTNGSEDYAEVDYIDQQGQQSLKVEVDRH